MSDLTPSNEAALLFAGAAILSLFGLPVIAYSVAKAIGLSTLASVGVGTGFAAVETYKLYSKHQANIKAANV